MSLFTSMRDWFRTPVTVAQEAKINPAYLALANYGDMPQPQMMPRAYRSFAKEGFRVDPTAYKCISYLSRNGAAIPPKLYTNRTCEKEITDHPLLDKLNAPNSEMSGVAYREAVMGFLLIAGNSYQYAIRSKGSSSSTGTKQNGSGSSNGNGNGGGPPDELWPLRPDLVQVVAGATRGVVGYKYEPAHSTQGNDAYAPGDVSHLKYWSADDSIYGLSPMEVAALLIDQQTAARKWNLALLQNWARLPGAWVVPVPMEKNARDRLEQKLKEKLSGYRNAGTPPVLDGGLVWQSMGVPPAQMDWLEGIQYNAAAIANIYNLPPMIIGDTSATTFDNMKQAEVFSYTEGIFPDLDRIYDNWNTWLVPMYPDLAKSGAYLYYDKETVEVIQEMIQAQKDAKSARATEMFGSTQITMNEARDMQGLPPLPGGDRLKLGSTLIPISLLDQPIVITAAATGIIEDPEDPKQLAAQQQAAAPAGGAPGTPGGAAPDGTAGATPPDQSQQQQAAPGGTPGAPTPAGAAGAGNGTAASAPAAGAAAANQKGGGVMLTHIPADISDDDLDQVVAAWGGDVGAGAGAGSQAGSGKAVTAGGTPAELTLAILRLRAMAEEEAQQEGGSKAYNDDEERAGGRWTSGGASGAASPQAGAVSSSGGSAASAQASAAETASPSAGEAAVVKMFAANNNSFLSPPLPGAPAITKGFAVATTPAATTVVKKTASKKAAVKTFVAKNAATLKKPKMSAAAVLDKREGTLVLRIHKIEDELEKAKTEARKQKVESMLDLAKGKLVVIEQEEKNPTAKKPKTPAATTTAKPKTPAATTPGAGSSSGGTTATPASAGKRGASSWGGEVAVLVKDRLGSGISGGLAVAPYPSRDVAFAETPDPQDIRDWLDDNSDVLSLPAHHAGARHDAASGETVLSVSIVVKHVAQAEQIARQFGLSAYVNLDTGEEVAVSWDEEAGMDEGEEEDAHAAA